MARKLFKVFFLLLFMASFSLCGFLYYGKLQLEKACLSLEEDVGEAEGRMSLFKKKYAEQKALAGGLTRVKRSLEEQINILQGQLKKMGEEKDAFLKEKASLNAQSMKKIASLKNELKRQKEAIAGLQTELSEKEKKQQAVLQDLQQELMEIKGDRETLEKRVERKSQEVERCLSHNSRLCIIAEELVEKYKNKGVVAALIKQEPLTQIEKIELEQFLQEYEEKINENKIDAAAPSSSSD